MTTAFGCFYVMAMLCFIIAFLVDWIRSRAHVRKYLKYGLTVGVIVAASQALALVTGSADSRYGPILGLICGISFLRMVGFTTLGMYYCYVMGRPSFPILLRRFPVVEAPAASGPPPVPEVVSPPAASAGMVSEVFEAASPDLLVPVDRPPGNPAVLPPPLPDVVSSPRGPAGAAPEVFRASPPGGIACADDPTVNPDIVRPPVPHVDGNSAVFSALVVAGLGVLYSVVLFGLTAPRLSERLKSAFGVKAIDSAQTITVPVLLFVLLVAFSEEIVFRLGVQNFLARYLRLRPGRYWIAILITATIWTSGHAGTLEPGWVKLAQVFPMGLLLGWLCQRYGAESSILAHMAFNGAMLFLSVQLLT